MKKPSFISHTSLAVLATLAGALHSFATEAVLTDDTTVNRAIPHAAYYTQPTLAVAASVQGVADLSYLKFDLSSLPPETTGTQVIRATLEVYCDNITKSGTWRAHVAAPTRLCLECLGQYDPADVSLEQTGMLDNPVYIDGLPKDHPFRSHENVFPFSLSVASMEMMLFLRMVIPHLGNADIGTQTQDFASGLLDIDMRSCKPNCPFCQLVGRGDRSGITVTGRHEVAEDARASQKARKRPKWSWWHWHGRK